MRAANVDAVSAESGSSPLLRRSQPLLTGEQRERERSILSGILFDCGLLGLFLAVSLAGGSFTLLAEVIRALPMNSIEIWSWITLRKIHRGRLSRLQFGVGKLEQLVSLVVGCGMLLGAAWIVAGALAIIAGERAVGTPLGLAMAAMLGALNLFINFLVWDQVRRATRGDRSIIMETQLASRRVKLLSSLVVQATMTVAAVCLDPVIAGWADVAGSLFVAAVVFANGMALVRSSLPDLIDHTADHWTQTAIDAVLLRHRDGFDLAGAVRSRRSGGTLFVEIQAAFPGELAVAEIDRRISALRAELLASLGKAEIAVLVTARP